MPADPLAWIEGELANLERLDLRRRLATRSTPQSATVVLDGAELVNFGANDYLGLAGDERLRQAARAANIGWGAGASPLVSGRGALHARLESELARFKGTQACLLFPSGFAANTGVIPSLVRRGDVVFSDAQNHASIIDGCRLSGATVQVFRHGDVGDLRTLLAAAPPQARKLIVTDGLFSMDGDLAPLADLAAEAERHGAMLMVDEAHATGVFGESGRGAAEHCGVHSFVHVHVGTLSKALGSAGGFVAGRRELIDWIVNRARSYVFSTAPPEPLAAASLKALEILEAEPHRRRTLLARAAAFRDRLRADGWRLGASQSQIVPLIVGEPSSALRLSAHLKRAGYFAPAIRPPSTPEGRSLVRLSLTWRHTEEVLERLAEELGRMRGDFR